MGEKEAKGDANGDWQNLHGKHLLAENLHIESGRFLDKGNTQHGANKLYTEI